MATQGPTSVTLVVYNDNDYEGGGDEVVASYYDPAKAEARAVELDRPIWEAAVAGQAREFARAREQVAAHPLLAVDRAYFDALAQTRGGAKSTRRAAREAIAVIPKPVFWGDSDPRDWLAFFEKSRDAIADFATWRAAHGRHRTLSCPVEDAPAAPQPR